jgi:ATP-dependent Zn protease
MALVDDDSFTKTDMAVNTAAAAAAANHQQQSLKRGEDDALDETEDESQDLVVKRNEESSSRQNNRILQRLRDVITAIVGLRPRNPNGRRARVVVVVGLAAMTTTAAAAAALILIGYYRTRRRRQRHRNKNSSSHQLLLPLLRLYSTAIWKMLIPRRPEHETAMEAPLSHLLRAADQGLIQRALLGSSVVYYCCRDDGNGILNSNHSEQSWRRSTLPRGNAQLHSDVLEKLSSNPSTQVSALGESLASRLATPMIAALPFVYLGLLYRMMKSLHGADMPPSSSSSSSRRNSDSTTNHKTTTFADVAGLDGVVEQVYDVVSYLRDPERYAALGARPPRGILLYGPPGGGKTLLARAVAGEAQVQAFVSCSASEFVEMYVGRGAARVRTLFQQTRQQARNGAKRQAWWNGLLRLIGVTRSTSQAASALAREKTAAILFIDELDALAKTRASWNSNDEREQTLNQLLTEMDGFAITDNDDVTLIVMAASNRADVIDPAVLRRFDRQIHVGYPDQAGRKAILQIHARRVLCTPVGTIDWDALAIMSDGFSGADLRNAANEAALVAVRDQAPAVDHARLRDAIQRIAQMKETVQRHPSSHNGSSALLSPPFFKVDLN